MKFSGARKFAVPYVAVSVLAWLSLLAVAQEPPPDIWIAARCEARHVAIILSSANFDRIAAGPGKLVGVVMDITDAGIAGVSVQMLDGTGRSLARTTTGKDGRYSISNIAPGVYSLLLSSLGYAVTRVDDVTIAPGSTTSLEGGRLWRGAASRTVHEGRFVGNDIVGGDETTHGHGVSQDQIASTTATPFGAQSIAPPSADTLFGTGGQFFALSEALAAKARAAGGQAAPDTAGEIYDLLAPDSVESVQLRGGDSVGWRLGNGAGHSADYEGRLATVIQGELPSGQYFVVRRSVGLSKSDMPTAELRQRIADFVASRQGHGMKHQILSVTALGNGHYAVLIRYDDVDFNGISLQEYTPASGGGESLRVLNSFGVVAGN